MGYYCILCNFKKNNKEQLEDKSKQIITLKCQHINISNHSLFRTVNLPCVLQLNKYYYNPRTLETAKVLAIWEKN